MKKSIILLTLLILSLSVMMPFLTAAAAEDVADSLAGNSGKYITVVYDNKNGLPTSEANAIEETEDGFIWIGSYSGLIRYDGYNFVRISSASGITSVVSLYVDSGQRLWIGTNDSGIALMSRGFLRMFGKADGLPALSVRSFVEADNGDIYVATTEGVCVVDEDLNIIVLDIPSINGEYIHRLAKGPEGLIYGLTRYGDVFTIKDRELFGYYRGEDIGADSTVQTILPDPQNPGYAYLGTQGSEILYGKFEIDFTVEEKIKPSRLVNINSLKLFDGRLWICADNGVGSFTRTGIQYYYDLDFDNSLEDVMVDYQGNLWFISSKLGVMKVVANHFTDLTRRYNLEPSIATTTCLFNNKLYIGNKNGGLTVLGKDSVASNIALGNVRTASGANLMYKNLLSMLDGATIRSIVRDSKNNLWISTYSRFGLIRFDGFNATCFTQDDGMPSNRIRIVYERPDGDIVAGCNGGVVLIRDDKVISFYGESDGIRNTEILTVTETADGKLLVGTDGGGIYVIDSAGVRHIGTDEGLSSDIVMRIKRDPRREDINWVVTSNALGYLDKDLNPVILRTFPYANNFDIFFDNNDQAWILSSNGIYVVTVQQLLDNVIEYEYSLYGPEDGLPCIATANSYCELTDSGDLYIAGSSGIAKVNINEPIEDVSVLKIDVPYIEADGQQVYADQAGVFNLPSDAKKVDITGYVFTYALMDPEITYYLEGFDKDTYSAKRSEFGTVTYTNLPGGRYRFVMKLHDTQGKEYKEYSITINKEMAFYEYASVRALGFLAVMGLIALAVWRLMHITIISRQYEQIRAAKEEAERANSAKSRFLANMSHEIRTPINTIMGMNEMISREADSSEPEEFVKNVKGYSGNIKVASESLLSLINDLLDMSKIESGKMELVEREYDVEELLRSLTMMIRVKSNQKDLTFDTDIDETIPRKLYGDNKKLKQVLLNLMSNAVKYTAKGGFTLIVKDNGRVGDTCRLYCAVRDTGIGIKPEDMSKLFSAFNRLEEEKNMEIQGTGLGLDISRQYVELMGGNIECESIYGEGSLFFFTINQKVVDDTPIGAFSETVNEVSTDTYRPLFVAPEARVMVVDDNDMNLQVIKGLLRHLKLKLTLVTGGKECLKILEEKSYHLVLLDHMMPEMDGIETLGHIREKFPDLPVIALTANVMTGGADFYKKAGFQDYLPKPVDAARLEETIRRYLPDEVIKDVSTEDTASLESEETALPEELKWMYRVDGLKVEDGLKYCGMPRQLAKFVNTFYDSIDEKCSEIESAYENKDYALYTIKVHALKGTARIMGATKLADLAQELEAAGKSGDTDRIEKDTSVLLDMYKSYSDKLAPIKSEESQQAFDDRIPISEANLENACNAVRDFIAQGNADAVESILAELKVYRLPREKEEKIKKIEDLLKESDWDGINKLLE